MKTGRNQGLGVVAPLLLLIGTACGGDGAATTIATTTQEIFAVASTTVPPTTAEPTTTSQATTTTHPEDAAPPEMLGKWSTDLKTGDPTMDRVGLRLTGVVYRISRGGNSANGTISVVGNEITFSGSSLCDGVGTYTWLIEEESLTFTAAEPADPCGGRRPVLDGVTYSR